MEGGQSKFEMGGGAGKAPGARRRSSARPEADLELGRWWKGSLVSFHHLPEEEQRQESPEWKKLSMCVCASGWGLGG